MQKLALKIKRSYLGFVEFQYSSDSKIYSSEANFELRFN